MTIMEISPSLYPDYCISPPSAPAYAIQFAYDCRLCIEIFHLKFPFDESGVMLMGRDNIYQKNNEMDLYMSKFIIILLSQRLRRPVIMEDSTSSSLGCTIRIQ